MRETRKIYLGNLKYDLTEEELRQAMQEKGVHAKDLKIVKDKFTGKSKGFGFAEFENEQDVEYAINTLNGQEIKGRMLKVSKARQQRPRFERNRKSRFRQ